MAKRRSADFEMEPNMTPMIDVVFQLIIFFMLVTEMSQADLEVMELPEADMAAPDKQPEKDRMVINVNSDGEIKIRGRKFGPKKLRDWLKREASIARDPKDKRLCTRALLIRADQDAQYKYIQHIMQECVQPGIGIWKVLLAAKEPPKKSGAFK
jgi:biopolymer transport protein ExbD